MLVIGFSAHVLPISTAAGRFRRCGKQANRDSYSAAVAALLDQFRILFLQMETGWISEMEFEAGKSGLVKRLEAMEGRPAGEEPSEDEAEESGETPRELGE